MEWFRGKRVLITGGSSGIGLATAQLLSQSGAHIYVVARNEARLEKAMVLIKAEASTTVQRFGSMALDVTNRHDVGNAVPKVLSELGGLDLLINNAGIAHPGYIQDISDDVFDSMMQVNYFGVVNVTKAFLPHFTAQRSGTIANVSSLLGFMGIFGYSAYAASKFAIVGFSDCLRQELLPYNIGMSILFPADTETPQLEEENKIKPFETKIISGNVKAMSAQEVAHAFLDGIAEGRYHIIPGFQGKFTYFMYRHFPWAVRWVIDGDLKKAQKKKLAAQAASN